MGEKYMPVLVANCERYGPVETDGVAAVWRLYRDEEQTLMIVAMGKV